MNSLHRRAALGAGISVVFALVLFTSLSAQPGSGEFPPLVGDGVADDTQALHPPNPKLAVDDSFE